MHPTLALAVSLLSLSAFAAPAERDSLLDEALFAGGARNQAELDRLVALYHQRIDPMVELVRDQPKAIAAQLLLKHLHVSYGGTTAVLEKYATGSWSLNEALDTGRFNCLSASTLFLLAARQAGLDVTGELYDRHARTVVTIDGRSFHVEATSRYGFNADAWFISTRARSLTSLEVAVELPYATGTDTLMDAAWVWAGEPRDAKWVSRIAISPPPLLSVSSLQK